MAGITPQEAGNLLNPNEAEAGYRGLTGRQQELSTAGFIGAAPPVPAPFNGVGGPPAPHPPTDPDAGIGLGPHPSRPPQPENFVERLAGLAKAHPWMPHQTVAMLAAIPASDSTVIQMANELRQAWGTSQRAITYITSDPVLQKTPSVGLALKTYLSGTIGPWPLADSDMVHIQKELQARGYGTGVGADVYGQPPEKLPADGVWTSGWNAAYNQYINDVKTMALGGNQPGSAPAGKVLQAAQALLPSESATSIIAFIKALPESAANDLRTVAGAVAGGAVNLGTQFEPKNLLNTNPQRNVAGEERAAAAAENVIPGSHVTPQTSFPAQGFRSQAENVASVVGDLLATHGLFGAGKTIATAAGETSLRGLDMAAAQRGPGVIAKSLYDGTAKAAGGEAGGLLSYPGTPILRYAGPVADRMIGSDGLYYKARTLLATPYAYGPVRVAGTTVGQVGLAGAKIRGIGAAEGLIGGDQSQLTQNINNYHGIDYIDAAIANKLQFTVLGHHIRPGLDTLAWVLHPPLSGPGMVSAGLGRDIGSGHDFVNTALGPSTGFSVSIERGVNAANPGKHMDYQDLVDHFGGATNFQKFWIPKIMYQHAAAHYAELAASKAAPEDIADTGGWDKYVQERAHEARNSPSLLIQAAKEMIANDNPAPGSWGGPQELSKRIAAEIVRETDGRRGWLNQNGQKFVEAGDLMRNHVVPRVAEMFADPVENGALGLARADYPTKETVLAAANDFEQRQQEARAAMAIQETARKGFQDLIQTDDDIRKYLKEQFGITQMPDDNTQLISRLRDRANSQAVAVYYRTHEAFSAPAQTTSPLINNPAERFNPATLSPEDSAEFNRLNGELGRTADSSFRIRGGTVQEYHDAVDAHAAFVRAHTPRAATGSLEGMVNGPVYHTGGAREAFRTLTEPDARRWHNAVQHAGSGAVTIEHDSSKLFGEKLSDPLATAQGRGEFRATRVNAEDPLNGVNAVEIRPVNGAYEQSAVDSLEAMLREANYKPVKMAAGATRWVHEEKAIGSPAASPALRAAFAGIKERGYKVVKGTDIGHAYMDQPTLDIMDAPLRRVRRVVEKAGLSPENIRTGEIGDTFNHNFLLELQKSVEGGKLRLMPYDSPNAIAARLRQASVIPQSNNLTTVLQKYGIGYKSKLNKLTEELLPEVRGAVSEKLTTEQLYAEAERRATAQLQAGVDNPMGLMNISYGQLEKVLGRKIEETSAEGQHFALSQGDEFTPVAGYDKKGVQEVYGAIQKAKAKLPWRLTGWQGIEYMLGQKLGFAGKAVPGDLGSWIENLPSRYVPLRNKLRFTLSPEFETRRLVKANYKAALDGVPMTVHPLRSLEQRGITQKALNELDRVMPEWRDPKHDSYDEGTQALYAGGLYGIYNHRYQEAWSAWHWNQMGKTDTEIRHLLVKDFGYGSEKFGEGRTALERSVNFMFFPFSFDKTLYRNTAMYLLDRPAQRMLLTAGLSMYNHWNQQHPEGDTFFTSSWFQKHMPLAQEALRLNAFAHGLGLGQPGGINAPILNLFIPQQYNADSAGLQAVKGFIPMVREFQNLSQETFQTLQIGEQEIKNTGHGPGSMWMPQVVAETSTAQRYDAYVYRRQVAKALEPSVFFNAHHRSGKKTVPNDPSRYGQWAGEVVNATLVDQLTHAKYPAFQISDPAVYYAQEAATIASYQQQMVASGHKKIATWIDDAQKIGTDIYNNKIPPSSQQSYQQIYRLYAIQYAETVPGFLAFYNKNFRWQLGPLEGVR